MSETQNVGGASSPAFDPAAMYRVVFARRLALASAKIRPGVAYEVRGDLLATVEADAIASAERI